ncbi:hypothetical protein P7C73_g1669, partial [Tremellales sp. Uapishka_1]
MTDGVNRMSGRTKLKSKPKPSKPNAAASNALFPRKRVVQPLSQEGKATETSSPPRRSRFNFSWAINGSIKREKGDRASPWYTKIKGEARVGETIPFSRARLKKEVEVLLQQPDLAGLDSVHLMR